MLLFLFLSISIPITLYNDLYYVLLFISVQVYCYLFYDTLKAEARGGSPTRTSLFSYGRDRSLDRTTNRNETNWVPSQGLLHISIDWPSTSTAAETLQNSVNDGVREQRKKKKNQTKSYIMPCTKRYLERERTHN
uniref:Putative secreted protein n=1 Tax=Anopheles darlingi TaxID=43151 RepID=A0A2M4D9Q9_ANODA